MARQPDIIPSIPLHTALRQDLMAKIDLYLWSDVEQRVPKGAYKRFFTHLAVEFFERLEKGKKDDTGN